MQNVFIWEVQEEAVSDAVVEDGIDTWVDDNWVAVWELLADNTVQLFLNEMDVLNLDGTVNRNLATELHVDNGSQESEAMPAADSYFIQAATDRAKSLGRKYVPGMAENQVADGKVSPGALATLVLLGVEYVLGIDVGATGLLAAGVLSRVTAQFQEFTSALLVTDIPAYQRRRKPFVGS